MCSLAASDSIRRICYISCARCRQITCMHSGVICSLHVLCCIRCLCICRIFRKCRSARYLRSTSCILPTSCQCTRQKQTKHDCCQFFLFHSILLLSPLPASTKSIASAAIKNAVKAQYLFAVVYVFISVLLTDSSRSFVSSCPPSVSVPPA